MVDDAPPRANHPDTLPRLAARLLEETRARHPRVHALTNAAAQAFTANLLLAAGAIPSLTVAAEEAEHFARRADAVLVNLGTLDAERRAGIPVAVAAAREAGRPLVLDPVFVEASPPRLAFARALLAERPAIVRLNPGELRALAGAAPGPAVAAGFARETGAVVALTGEVDVVTDGDRTIRIANGHSLMAAITAMGCAGSALLAAFAALHEDHSEAAAAALLVLGVAGEIAGARAAGPGSFPAAYLDALHALDEAALSDLARIS
ncbi:hydroxyethylthiazole kinase [Salinarimonas ramus]|uniref:Hydroxyethylthiazole kinase n=1 Tax=Salinarimonas ramus TaxID=690164 RepID=A0A917Q3X1_9HYPH|nr:hydroxyethylthiazole kinase [Salinarimonas ramus]GGK19595.1 putative hydroxyethylthiazole kinase [Salinarimonas ramus]